VTVDYVLPGPTHPTNVLQWYLRDSASWKFLYCRKGDEWKGFSFFFWAVPFDEAGWALVALSLLSLTVVLKGDWLFAFGALFVRQGFEALNTKRILILFVLSAIVLTGGYEGVISSLVIIPPPPIVAITLKDLIDSGYTLHGWKKNVEHGTILNILKRENVPYTTVTQWPFVTGREKEIWRFWESNSVIIEDMKIEISQEIADYFYPHLGLKCHHVKETVYPRQFHITYSGYASHTIQILMRSFTESGVLGMWYSYASYATNIIAKLRSERRKYREANTETPFELNDPKIMSIFIGWGVLVVCGFLAFMLEVVFAYLQHRVGSKASAC
jgi:hypothetical protein